MAETGSKRLYVGNLPYQAIDKDIEVIFTDAGFQIERLDISTDPFTGRNPSYCFVELNSEDEAARAIRELNSQQVMGRPIKINFNTLRGKPRDGASRPPTLSYDRGWRPQASQPRDVGESAGNSYVFNRWERNDAERHHQGPSEEGRRIYVGGLPRIPNQDTVNEEMRALFKDYQLEAVSKIISPHPSTADQPGSHYYLFVDMPTAADAESAVKALDGTNTPWGGTFKINIARNKQNRKIDRKQYPNHNDDKATGRETTGSPIRDFSGNWRRKE